MTPSPAFLQGVLGALVALSSASVALAQSRVALRVESTPPGATVFVDGTRIGTSPVEVQTSPGRHQVELELEGHYRFEQEVNVRDGDRLVVGLTPLMGQLHIESNEAAIVRVDGRDQGTAPLSVALPVGSHQVELVFAGQRLRRTIEVRAFETTNLVHRFQPLASSRLSAPPPASGRVPRGESGRPPLAPFPPLVAFVRRGSPPLAPFPSAPDDWGQRATLTINTTPWARVFIDGFPTGITTPVVGLHISPGRHRIGLQTEDGEVHGVTIQASPGQHVRLTRRLE